MLALSPPLPRHIRLGLVALATVTLLTACVDRAAISDLATTGSDVATTLGKVYALIQDEAHDYESLRSVLLALNPKAENTQPPWVAGALETQLDIRIHMTQGLVRVYGALSSLASDKASQDLVSAGQRFGSTLKQLAPVLGVPTPATSALQGAQILGGLLAQWKMNQDLEQALGDVAPAPRRVADLFDDEAPDLALVATTYSSMLHSLAANVLTLGVVRQEDVLRMLSDMYGLPLGSPCPASSTSDCAAVARALLRARADRVSALTQGALNTTGRALAALASLQMARPLQEQTGPIRLAAQAVTETQGYLTQIAGLRAAPQPPR